MPTKGKSGVPLRLNKRIGLPANTCPTRAIATPSTNQPNRIGICGAIACIDTGGAIGNGSFALHAKSVFLSRSPTFAYFGETTLNDRRAIRYDYRIPQMLSGYEIRVGPNHAIMEYHGSFWVDADTLDLIRLEVHADKPPPNLNLTEASDTMEYRRARIGGAEFLLPQSSELQMIDLLGNVVRNRTQFSACRQYAGESKLSFVEFLGRICV